MTDKDPMSNPFFVHPDDTNVLSLVTTPFNGDDYSSCKRSMLISLSAKNKTGFINGDLVRPITDVVKIRQWDRCNDIVISWIFGSVSEEIKASVLFTETAKGIWEELEERFEQYNGARLYQVQDSLN
ncbi:uncharacterized protein LOC141620460 [Silene latifolia]|uniref:uncharacterized protein LOC141620460 n=1 Tax=Silene latifolia TaxID=37657 RepID=UPI003D77E238